ncbi:tetranectin [Fukomys damarensis]|uniref:tetranectin n=1 Tax=Fukomys damarensis TaxID=885580 RepID=UPI00053F5115|nr:tetranectin [Fukomys damarensis]
MELRGPQLLLCVLALLTQVAAEVPTSKPKKVVNARKDIVSPKTIEELKSRLDALAQEVVVLKEQQALQTGERGRPVTLSPGRRSCLCRPLRVAQEPGPKQAGGTGAAAGPLPK